MKFKILGNDFSQTDSSSLNHQVLFTYMFTGQNIINDQSQGTIVCSFREREVPLFAGAFWDMF